MFLGSFLAVWAKQESKLNSLSIQQFDSNEIPKASLNCHSLLSISNGYPTPAHIINEDEGDDTACKIGFRFVRSEYKSYASSKGYLIPDCVAALNCGFVFYKSWDASIPAMLKNKGVPLVFTEYYLEDCRSVLISRTIKLLSFPINFFFPFPA